MSVEKLMSAFDRKWAAVEAKKDEIMLARIRVQSCAETLIEAKDPKALVDMYIDWFRERIAEVKRLEHERSELVSRDYLEFADETELAGVNALEAF